MISAKNNLSQQLITTHHSQKDYYQIHLCLIEWAKQDLITTINHHKSTTKEVTNDKQNEKKPI